MQAPDIGPLVQAELLARGFGQPKTLTNSLLAIVKTFYKITTPGFRHIPMLTITREIFSRLPNNDKTESSHVALATMDTMKAMLPSKDMDIIGPFIREHFQVNCTKEKEGLVMCIQKLCQAYRISHRVRFC